MANTRVRRQVVCVSVTPDSMENPVTPVDMAPWHDSELAQLFLLLLCDVIHVYGQSSLCNHLADHFKTWKNNQGWSHLLESV